jgi:hypothetical protein
MAIPGAMLLAFAGPLAAQALLDPPSGTCSRHFLSQAVVVGRYTFKAYKNLQTGGACLEVEEQGDRDAGHKEKAIGRMADKLTRKDAGQIVFRRTIESFGQFTLGQTANPQYDIPKVENGADITGRGRPDFIVTNWSGGAHCCFSHYVFELEPRLGLLAEINDEDGNMAHFGELDGSRKYYFIGNDWTFAYWDASFADSPAPAVVLHFVDGGDGGTYRLAMDQMQRPRPSEKAWNKAIKEAKDAFAAGGSFGDGIGSALWSNMLNLIYTGHSDLAWKLFDEAWPRERPNRDKFLAGFCTQLKTSPYWPDLQGTMHGAPPACTGARSETSGQ